MNQEQFYNSVRGKTVTFCGIGRSHMPLMEKFQQAGALVSAGISVPSLNWGKREGVTGFGSNAHSGGRLFTES